MSLKSNRKHKVSQDYEYNQIGSVKILIEQRTIGVVFAVVFVLLKIVSVFWPISLSMQYTLHDVLLLMSSALRTYPALAGFLLSFLTWHIMYFDSAVPGIDPPTPFSPSKYREVSGADFHLNYMFTLFIGPMVAVFLYVGWI